MLVLSRREGEKIVFPTIGVTVHVLRIKGNTSRLGIQAPSDVKVLRNELVDVPAEVKAAGAKVRLSPLNRLRHDVLNRLHSAKLAMAMYRRHVAAGREAEAAAMLQMILEELEGLEREAVATRTQPPEPERTELHRALVVEDDANECELLAGFLRMCGFEVVTAGDGSDALDYLASHERPDIVLLDMLMPQCDGPTTIVEIRRKPEYQGMKVFAISGTSPSALGVATGPTGVDRWFRKPVNPENLVQEIERELVAVPRMG